MVLFKEPRQTISEPIIFSRPVGSSVNLRRREGIPGMSCQTMESNDALAHCSQRRVREEYRV